MENNKEAQSKSGIDTRWVIVAAAAVAITFIVTMAGRGGKEPANVSVDSGDNIPALTYAEGVTALDEDSLQEAVDDLYRRANRSGFVTAFKNDAYSTDGQTFECYVGNSNLNDYDMFIQIFADAEMTDRVFLSGLLRPGTTFREITLDHPLEPGTHTLSVIFTPVEGEDLENMVIVGQVGVTMDFTVAE